MRMLEMAPTDISPWHLESRVGLGVHGEPVAILELVPAPGAIGSGRRWVTETAVAQGADGDVVDLVELLASELLTNAVQHGPAQGAIVVHVVRHRGVLRVTVHDDGSERPVMRPAGPEDEGGRGLQLVDMLADSWGTDRDPTGGKAVWFEVTVIPTAG